MSDIGRRLIGASAVMAANNHDVGDVDLEGLVRRLLLFDKYVMVSVRLGEFPVLARRLGYEQLRDLLSTGLIEIRHECLQLVQTGQSGMFGDPMLPPFSYQFHWIDAHDKEGYLHDSLQQMHGVAGLTHKQVLKLKRLIAEAIHPLSDDLRPQLFPAFRDELLHNPRLLKQSLQMEVRRRTGLENLPFNLVVHQEAESTFKIETDIAQRLRVDEMEGHRIAEIGILGVAGLIQAVGEMREYSAISGFRDEELPLFRHKLSFLADTASSQAREQSFQRVLDIAGFPGASGDEGRISIERLLKVRESREVREFRDWLLGIGMATDAEIAERTSGLRAVAGLNVGGNVGRVLRCLVTTAIGFVPHAVPAAVGLTLFDQFVLDKLLPRSGIAAFVHELYPSIFEKGK
ncbi:MAG: hypothetical protein WAN65_09200 [Candidatus Sulfotelmatobacter sp.]